MNYIVFVQHPGEYHCSGFSVGQNKLLNI